MMQHPVCEVKGGGRRVSGSVVGCLVCETGLPRQRLKESLPNRRGDGSIEQLELSMVAFVSQFCLKLAEVDEGFTSPLPCAHAPADVPAHFTFLDTIEQHAQRQGFWRGRGEGGSCWGAQQPRSAARQGLGC